MPSLAELSDYYPQADNTLPVDNTDLIDSYAKTMGISADEFLKKYDISNEGVKLKPNIIDRRNDKPIDTTTWPRPDGVLQLPNKFDQGNGTMAAFNADTDFLPTPAFNPLGKDLGINNLSARPEPLAEPISPQTSDINGDDMTTPNASGFGNHPLVKQLLGLGGEERYQLWPERIVREALSVPHDVMTGDLPTQIVDPTTGEVVTSPQLIAGAQAMSALAGTGGLAGADASLGSTAFLRPALKYENKIYKAPMGGQHLDALPAHLAEDFQTKAMAGEDINHYNFGFMNHKGQFLSREAALDYAVKEGLVDPSAGQYGALTSTLMADSSKPGTAIESLAKTAPKLESVGDGRFYIKDADGNHLGRVAVQPSADGKTVKILHMEAGKENALGLPAIQALKSQLKTFYPEATNVEGFRVGGANPGRNLNTLLADSSKPGTAIEAMAKSNPFYSALEHNVNAIQQGKMTGDQWLGTLANKPGVKSEELDWTGVKDYLKERGNQPVTKAELQEHLANNKVELKEVNKGNGVEKSAHDDLEKSIGNSAVVNGEKLYPDEIISGIYNGDFKPSDLPTHLQDKAQALLDAKAARNDNTKYHSYQLPGGENYREKLLTLPTGTQKYNEFIKEIRAKHGEGGLSKLPLTDAERATYETRLAAAEKDESPAYKSSHWDEPNILAHVRMNDRTIDGKKSLHIEEIQSDWHQQGRDRGYKGQASNTDGWTATQNKNGSWDVRNKDGIYVRENVFASDDGALRASNAENAIKIASKEPMNGMGGVPNAPFKKTWHELALKRMIREAAEKGYDRLSWTPGEAQAARYDLSKSIGSLKATPIMDQHGLKYEIRATNPNGTQEVLNQVHTANELPNVVGKEMAKKIIDETEGKHPKTFKGLDLKVGGEGIKGFYDQIIPKALEKISGEKVKTANIAGKESTTYNGPSKTIDELIKLHDDSSLSRRDNIKLGDVIADMSTGSNFKEAMAKHATDYLAAHLGGEIKPMASKQLIHYIDIPQALKDKALGKGFPLFSSTHMYTPIAGNPFESKDK